MSGLKTRIAALAVGALVCLGGAAEVSAQYGVSVYNPGNYSRTRQTMSTRAAARAATRAALRKKKKRAARRAARRVSRQTVSRTGRV